MNRRGFLAAIAAIFVALRVGKWPTCGAVRGKHFTCVLPLGHRHAHASEWENLSTWGRMRLEWPEGGDMYDAWDDKGNTRSGRQDMSESERKT